MLALGLPRPLTGTDGGPRTTTAPGVALWIDGEPVALGEPVAETTDQGDALTIRGGRNVGGAGQAGGGYGVLLVLQTEAGGRLGPATTPADVRVVSLAVWRDAAFSSSTVRAEPGRAPPGLELRYGERLAGSYEARIEGGLGPLAVRVEFDLPPP